MKGRILIVEDEPKISQLLAVNFTGTGYEVDTAASGEEGLEKVSSFKPDILMLDVKLPGISGWDVCKKIKTTPEYRDIAVIIVTASSQKSDMERSVNVRSDCFFSKPFEIELIMEKVAELLNRKKQKK